MVPHCQGFVLCRKVIFLGDEAKSVLERGVKKGHHTGKRKLLLNQVQTDFVAGFSVRK